MVKGPIIMGKKLILIDAAFPQHGQHQLVHNPIVEAITRYTDAGRAKRYAALRRARRLDPHHGK